MPRRTCAVIRNLENEALPSCREQRTSLAASQRRAAELAKWLETAAILQSEDEDDGAVVTWREANGAWNAGYPEMAGYYLSFLSCKNDPGSAGRARRVTRWLDCISHHGPPMTRYYSGTDHNDWRNRAIFSFDLAMVLRGLVMARAAFIETVPDNLVERFGTMLLNIQKDGVLTSHHMRRNEPSAALPDRWSTRPGFYQLKAAAALDFWDDNRARSVSRQTVVTWLPRLQGLLERGRIEEAHPYLYGIEGLLILYGRTGEPVYLTYACNAFRQHLQQLANNAEYAHHQGARGDVVAQTVRAGSLLAASGILKDSLWQEARDTLLVRLDQLHATEGVVIFSADVPHRNAWASVFAWQAWTALCAVTDVSLDARELCAVLI